MDKRINYIMFLLVMSIPVLAYANTTSPTEGIITTLTEYGLLGVIVIALGWYILNMQKRFDAAQADRDITLKAVVAEHKAERKEWRTEFMDQYKKTYDVAEKSANVMTDVKSILQSIDRNTQK